MTRARPVLAVLLPTSLLAAGWAGCDPHYPGDSLGGFRVHGDLAEQTCGSTVVMPNDPLDFRVELRRDGATMYWRRPGMPMMDGRYVEGDGSFEMSATSTFQLRPPIPAGDLVMDGATGEVRESPGLAECRILQQESISGTLDPVPPTSDEAADAGPPPAVDEPDTGVMTHGPTYRWTGENRVSFSVTAGADCRDRIGTGSGQFPELPCRIVYELEGEPMEATPDW